MRVYRTPIEKAAGCARCETPIDDVSDLEVTLDGKPIHHVRRVESDVFDVTLPEDNVFGAPAGVYSPAVDDGIDAFLKPLHVGTHKLHIQATSGNTSSDVTCTLVVVPVRRR